MAIDMKAMANYVFEIDRLGSVFRESMQYSSDMYKNSRSTAFLDWAEEHGGSGRKSTYKSQFLKHMTKALIRMDRFQADAARDFKLGKILAKNNYEAEKTFNKVMVSPEFYGTRTE